MANYRRPEAFDLSRRDFLKATGVSLLGLALRTSLRAEGQQLTLARVEIIRPRDLLKLTFELRGNIRRSPDTGRLIFSPISGADPNVVGIQYPPQHIAEGWIAENSEQSPPDLPPHLVPARIAGPSRLVFRRDARHTTAPIPLSVEQLLRWTRQSAVEAARQAIAWIKNERYTRGEPTENESVLEFPYRLFISPVPNTRFFHCVVPYRRVQPIRGVKWTWVELWHSAMDLRTPSARKEYFPPIFALEPTDTEETLAKITEGPISANDDARGLLVPTNLRPKVRPQQPLECDVLPVSNEDTGWGPNYHDFELLMQQSEGHDGVLRAKQLLLTSMGASADLDYRAQLNFPGDLRQWIHKTAIGRDNYVRTVINGVLMPFQHPAAFIQIWERKLTPKLGDASGTRVGAIIRKRRYLLILDPDRSFPTSDETDHIAANALARGMFIKSVRIKDDRTPLLSDALDADSLKEVEPIANANFWPRVEQNGTRVPFEFECEGIDAHGLQCTFRMPMLFMVKLELGGIQYHKAPQYLRTATFAPAPFLLAPISGAPINATEFTDKLSTFAEYAQKIQGFGPRKIAMLADLKQKAYGAHQH